MSRGSIAQVRQRLSSAYAEPMAEALDAARQQPVAYLDEIGAPTGNADVNNPTGKRTLQWVMVTPVVTVFVQGLSRSTAAAIELLGNAFGGIVVSDRFSTWNHLPIQQRDQQQDPLWFAHKTAESSVGDELKKLTNSMELN